MSIIKGFHHLTACVSGAQEDVDFYVKLLGQSLAQYAVLEHTAGQRNPGQGRTQT